jgi:hypothetical protein
MEGNEKLLYESVVKLTDLVKGFEQRLIKNEQLVLQSFTYLYEKCEKIDNQIELINQQLSYVNTEQEKIKYYRIDNSWHEEPDEVDDNENDNILTKSQSEEIDVKKPFKRKRPWYYKFIKNWKYKKLCKERKILEAQIEEDLRKKKEQEEKEKAEELRIRKKLEEERRQKEEKLAIERRKKAQEQMSRILQRINK